MKRVIKQLRALTRLLVKVDKDINDFQDVIKECIFDWHTKHTLRMWKLEHGLVEGDNV